VVAGDEVDAVLRAQVVTTASEVIASEDLTEGEL
jgi:hypothetical protein